MTLIALAHEGPQIAGKLHISEATVRHVRNAMSKQGARTRAQLVAISLCSAELRVCVPPIPEGGAPMPRSRPLNRVRLAAGPTTENR